MCIGEIARFLLQSSVGTMPHRDVMRSIELLGTEVAPAVHRALREPAPTASGPPALTTPPGD